MERDVSAYYDQTQNHYQRWWQLDVAMSLHYGLWQPKTRNFLEALKNTNRYMAENAEIEVGMRVLDAGCGVGGAAVFLAKSFEAQVTGLSLSSLQIETAKTNALKSGVEQLTSFYQQDFTATEFSDESFDIIWACESSSSVAQKGKMVAEWNRLLKPGGKLILLDFFKDEINQQDPGNWLAKWCDLWAMSPLVSLSEFTETLRANKFKIQQFQNLTNEVLPTIKRMHFSYWLGLLPSLLYNAIYPASQYSRNHYKSGLYQYKAYKLGLWSYHSIIASKSDLKH